MRLRVSCQSHSKGRASAAVFLALVVVLLTPAVASAVPTSEFTIDNAAPQAGEPVAFTFTGACDLPPCRIQWRWFQTGGSHLGTTMGEGPQLAYAFPRSG